MSDNTDNRPAGDHNSHLDNSAANGAVPASPQPESTTPTAPRYDVPPVPTRSPASAAAAWPPPAAGTAPQHPGYASAPSGATTPTGQAFGPAATDAHPTLAMPSSTSTAPRKKSSVPRVAALLVAAALVGGGAGLGGTYAGLNLWGGSNTSAASGPSAITVNNPDSVNNTSAVAAKVVPSVVTISATAGQSGGTGSGVILSQDGYVLTNTHVVTLDGQSGSAKISVTTSDGKVYSAKVVGTDPTYDLAVIKLDNASGLTPIEWADSSKLNVGDNAIAIGAPLDLPNTVTTGIVSALNRSIQVASSAAPSDGTDQQQQEPGQESPFRFDFGQGQEQQSASQTIKIAVIQTDAAINPGNSGGALVDTNGNLLGINTAIYSRTGGSLGIGFAIPVTTVKTVMESIIKTGQVVRGWIGVEPQDITPELAESFGLQRKSGTIIAGVLRNGPADRAGMRPGDILVEVDGRPVDDTTSMLNLIAQLQPGRKASMKVLRKNAETSLDVTVGVRPKMQTRPAE